MKDTAKHRPRHRLFFGLCLSLCAGSPAAAEVAPGEHSDSGSPMLERFRQQLALVSHSPIQAEVQLQSLSTDGKGDSLRERPGELHFRVEYGAEGLSLHYSPQTLAALDAERRLKVQEPDADSPHLNALNALDLTDVKDLLDPTKALSRSIDSAEFLGEEAIACGEASCTQLQFAYGEERLSGSNKRFVKDFEGRIEVVVDAEGRPQRAKQHSLAKGRVFLIIGFQSSTESHWEYGYNEGRLITKEHRSYRESSGGGEQASMEQNYSLRPLPSAAEDP